LYDNGIKLIPMKKRQFTTLLLIWLFSQPLLAAV